MDFLIDFIEKRDCFEPADKLKLILFAARTKPSTFVSLKITPRNIGDKFHFERHLKDHNIFFNVDKPKSFEEISKIKNNKIVWSLKGTWYGYDLFKDKQHQRLFKRYLSFVKRQKKDDADIAAGKVYGYPACCIKQYIKENDLDWLKNNFSYYSYYKRLHDSERKFPFIAHTPCSTKCDISRKLNIKYKNIIKKRAPKFFKEFSKKKYFRTDFIVEGENNLMVGINNRPLWVKQDAHEYTVIANKPYNKHFYLLSYLTKEKEYAKGSLLSGSAEMQYNYADIKINKLKKVIPNLVHIRKFKLLGRKY
ncbi:hypothetical protein JW851_04275 [Candidatus Woesearchaeota archaeon]|nr:hypothetical protein [Candidatus Woesearchaeota archaeon]